MNETIKKLIEDCRNDCVFFNIDDSIADALEIAVEALERYADTEIQNQHNYKAIMSVDDTKTAREALHQIQAIAEGGKDE